MAVSLFAYRKGTSVLHRTPPLLKLTLLFVLCIITFSGSSASSAAQTVLSARMLIRTAACLAVSMAAFVLSGAHIKSIQSLAFVPVLGLAVMLFNVLCLPPSPQDGNAHDSVITVLPFLAINIRGIWFSLLYTVRFFITSLAAQVVFETTSSLEIKNAFESVQDMLSHVIPPLKQWNPALVLSLAINFIPQVFDTWNRVHTACLARSDSRRKKNPFAAITAASYELQALLSCLLFQAETKRKAILNRTER